MEQEAILVVEDSDRLRRFILSSLKKEGYRVFEAPDCAAAYGILRDEYLDLVLLDLRLGEQDGLEILKTIRRQDEEMPVIIVSSMDDREIKVGGFELGCDDYITKPFYVEELLSRVKRLLKRSGFRPSETPRVLERIVSGPFTLEPHSLSVTKNDVPLVMRKKLYDLFQYFVRHEDVILSAEELYGRAWDYRETMNENSLYVHIRHLRALIEDDPGQPRHIITIRNLGYRYSSKG